MQFRGRINRRYSKIALGCIVPLLTFIYTFGDYNEWWDRLRRRDVVARGIERLSSVEGFPTVCIFKDEPEFEPLLNLIVSRTNYTEAVKAYQSGKKPSAIALVGGPITPWGFDGENLADLPDPRFISESLPISFLYGYSREDYPKRLQDVGGELKSIGQLRDLRTWLQEARTTEQFIVSGVLISLLSIIVLFLDNDVVGNGEDVKSSDCLNKIPERDTVE